MYLISKLLIEMKFDSQHTRETANQFLGLAYMPGYVPLKYVFADMVRKDACLHKQFVFAIRK